MQRLIWPRNGSSILDLAKAALRQRLANRSSISFLEAAVVIVCRYEDRKNALSVAVPQSNPILARTCLISMSH